MRTYIRDRVAVPEPECGFARTHTPFSIACTARWTTRCTRTVFSTSSSFPRTWMCHQQARLADAGLAAECALFGQIATTERVQDNPGARRVAKLAVPTY